MAIRTIRLSDAEYPENLRQITAPPKSLRVNGTFLPQDRLAVALVGSRRATPYGVEMSERLAFELAASGVTVVSGMARGIDAAAHRGALKAKGRTIAVMGSGHNDIYPAENAALYAEIAASGAAVTEYDDDMPPLPYNFPARNRIISGLSLGVVVVEAARNSGALITADFAAEQGREVFALPGKVSSQTSAGTNALIKDGARLVTSAADILEELRIIELQPADEGKRQQAAAKAAAKTKAYIYNALTEDERAVYTELSDEPLHIDELGERTGFDVAKMAKVILQMQMKKVIRELPGKQFVQRSDNA